MHLEKLDSPTAARLDESATALRRYRCWLPALLLANLLLLDSWTERRQYAVEPVPSPRFPQVEARPESPSPSPPAALISEWPRLTFDGPFEGSLPEGGIQVYRVHLAQGDFLQATVDQLGADVVVTVQDPAGHTVLEVDSPNGHWGPEPVFWVAATPGLHRLQLTASGTVERGAYRLRLDALRPATPRDQTRATAALHFAEGEHRRRQRTPESSRLALDAYHLALKHWMDVGDPTWEATALERLSQVHQHLGQFEMALRSLEEARDRLMDQHDAEETLGWISNRLGTFRKGLGDLTGALEDYDRALALARRTGNRTREAASLNNIALIYQRQGRIYETLGYFQNALTLWESLGDNPRAMAKTLGNLGELYTRIGRPDRAREYLQEALRLWRRHGMRGEEASALGKLGSVERHAGNLGLARDLLLEALNLHHEWEGSRPSSEARILNDLGIFSSDQGQYEEAFDFYHQALEIHTARKDPLKAMKVRLNIGWLFEKGGYNEKAVTEFRAVVEKARSHGDHTIEASALFGTAKIARRQGDLVRAHTLIEKSLDLLEDLRRAARAPSVRASYLHAKYNYHAFHVDLLAARHEIEPEAGFDRLALKALERTRARSLIERFQQTRSGRRLEDEWALRLQAVKGKISRIERERLTAGSMEGGLASLLLERDILEGERIPTSSRSQDNTGAPTLSPAEIQALLDDNTVLLVYSLGEARSLLWWVTSREIRLRFLPPAALIEDLARSAYEMLSQGGVYRQDPEKMRRDLALAKLSRVLLGPVEERLQGQRLVILADGVLHYIPFAALPRPGGDPAALLISHHEISRLSSTSLLALIRQREAQRTPPPGRLAILADPVFEKYDSRLPSRGRVVNGGKEIPMINLSDSLAREAGNDVGIQHFERLYASREEARALKSLVEGEDHLFLLDFDARRDVVTSGALTRYRILHFATHGILNERDPELAGLVLSLINRRGEAINGFLRVQEILDLHLSADLVVLSACRTALGEQLRGEGIMGLSQSFLVAGASRTLVSLWSVDDQATAELMERFYRALLLENSRPIEALRLAQIALREDDRWSSPYYWAGFVLEGEWL